VAGTHELAVDHVALDEIVIEMRAATRRAAQASVVASPHDELVTVELDRDHASGREGNA
jgi:hypothetical protein